jgi:D-amino-acid oxidase
MTHVCVLGAGVTGLTTALALEEAGFHVRVVAAATGASTTWWSEAAGGAELVNDPILLARFANKARYLWAFAAPRVEPLLYLGWAEKRLARPIERRRITSFDEPRADLIINCNGLQARALTGDKELQAIYGQTVIVEPGNLDLHETIEDNRPIHGENQTFYTIPRRGEVVLGGVAIPCSDDTPATPTAATREAILSRCAPYGLRPGRMLRDSAGLRPYRTTVRLERDPDDPRIIHNYGHGGAGFTLSRGCAEDVVRLARSPH